MSSSPSTNATNTSSRPAGAPPDANLESALGYRFADKRLLERALTHKSFAADHNERLEFLGDAVLGYVVAHYLFEQQPGAHEDSLSLLRASLVRRETLAEIAADMDLGAYLRLGVGVRRGGGHRLASVLADALEALFGAIRLDGGIEAARDVILRQIEPRARNLDVETLKDAKTRLQEALQGASEDLPVYDIVATTGSAHARLFTVSCRVDAFDASVTAEGPSRRAAEKRAAALMLERLSGRLGA